MIRHLVFALALALSATGAWGDMYDDCKQSADPDLRIRGCTQVIGRGEKETRKNITAAYYNRGSAYATKGELDRAIANLSKAIALNPKYADAYNNRGRAYEKMGDKEQAIADYRKALEIDPSNQLAKNNLKRLGVTP